MNEMVLKPRLVDGETALKHALEPHWRWDRAIPAHGHSGVDFETRVDFRRGTGNNPTAPPAVRAS